MLTVPSATTTARPTDKVSAIPTPGRERREFFSFEAILALEPLCRWSKKSTKQRPKRALGG